jgi:hypothetical protein
MFMMVIDRSWIDLSKYSLKMDPLSYEAGAQYVARQTSAENMRESLWTSLILRAFSGDKAYINNR